MIPYTHDYHFLYFFYISFNLFPVPVLLIRDRDFPINIPHLGRILLNQGNDTLRCFPHDVIVMVHHNDFGFRNKFNGFNLHMVQQEWFPVQLCQADHCTTPFPYNAGCGARNLRARPASLCLSSCLTASCLPDRKAFHRSQ